MKDMVISLVHERRFWMAVAALGAAVTVGLLSWWAYSSYAVARDRRAQLAFVEQLERFEALRVNPDADTVAWEAIEVGLARGYVEHSSSSLAPFFLALQSEILLRKGQPEQALESMIKAVAHMPEHSVVTSLYKTKLAVMRLDSATPTVHEQGKQELLHLAQDARNKMAGWAWYHLWEWAFVNRDEALQKLAHTKLQPYPMFSYKIRTLLEGSPEHGE